MLANEARRLEDPVIDEPRAPDGFVPGWLR